MPCFGLFLCNYGSDANEDYGTVSVSPLKKQLPNYFLPQLVRQEVKGLLELLSLRLFCLVPSHNSRSKGDPAVFTITCLTFSAPACRAGID